MTTGKGVTADAGDGDGSIVIPRPAWLPSVGDSSQGPAVDRDSLPQDDAFEILRNPRRRQALRVLSTGDDVVELTDLATTVAAIENDKRPDDITAAERKRVYISLYQCHVSKMVDAGVIEYDEETRAVEITPDGAELAGILESFASGATGGGLAYSVVALGAFVLSIATLYASVISAATLFLGVGISFSVFSYLRSTA